MDRYNWHMGVFLFAASDEDLRTDELAELSGIELYQIDLDIDWQSGRRERNLHFSTVRSVLANR